MYCPGCHRNIWFFQKTSHYGLWHKVCSDIWENGYDSAFNFSKHECEIHDVKNPWRLHRERWVKDGKKVLEERLQKS